MGQTGSSASLRASSSASSWTSSGASSRAPARLARAVLGLLTTAALARVTFPLANSSWPNSPAAVRAEDVIGGLVAWSGFALSAWLTASTLLITLTAVPGSIGRTASVLSDTLTPALVRRGISLLLGASVGTLVLPPGTALGDGAHRDVGPSITAPVAPDPSYAASSAPAAVGSLDASDPLRPRAASGSAPDPAFLPSLGPGLLAPAPPRVPPPPRGPAAADPTSSAPSPAYEATAVSVAAPPVTPEPGWVPTRPRPRPDAETSRLLAPLPRTTFEPEESVTVRRGDSLWQIAARHLGPGAGDAEIALAWPAWYALNADVIGTDPDLIHPGLQLRVPTDGDLK